MKVKHLPSLLIIFRLLIATDPATAQSTAFTYQGSLTANAGPANGNFDLTFALFNSSNAIAQVGSTLTNMAVQVTNGLFTAAIDFGSNAPAIFNGSSLWLEVGVRTNGATNAFTTLTPLQPITPTPYAITASNLSGTLSASQLNGILPNNVFPATLPPVSGANLTNLPAANLTGSLPAISGANLTALNASQITNGVLPFTNGGNGFNAILNVRNYGAKGDGITDDSMAIRNCIKSAATNGYAVVYIPAGTYLLNTTNGTTNPDSDTVNCIFSFTNNTTVYGDGIDRTVLRVGNGVGNNTPVFSSLGGSITNMAIRSMTVDCNISGRGLSSELYGYDGVTWFLGGTNIYIADVKGINTAGECFDTGYTSFALVERCIAIGSSGTGLTFSGPNGTARDCQIYGCGYGEEAYDTVRHWGAGLTIAYGAGNMLVENCQFITNCMNLQVFAAAGVNINDCYFLPAANNTNYDLYLNPVNGRIINVCVTGCSFNDSTANIGRAVYGTSGFQFCKNFCGNGQLVMDNTTSAQVLDNQFISSSSSAGQIVLTNSTVAEVALNYFNENEETPIFLYSPGNFVHNNVFYQCWAMVDIESSGNTFSGNISSDSNGYYDVYLTGSTNWILNNAFGSAILFASGGATGNQVLNNTGSAPLIWDAAANGNTFAFNNFPAGPVQSGNTYVANLQGQLASGTLNFDTLNANTATIGTLTVGNALAPSILPYRAGTATIGSSSTSQHVTFSSPFPPSVGTSYRVGITFDSTLSSAVSASATSKTTNGFIVTLSAGISGGAQVDWTAFPDN